MTMLRFRIGFGPPGMIRRRPQKAGSVAVSARTMAGRPAGAGAAASDLAPPSTPKFVSICAPYWSASDAITSDWSDAGDVDESLQAAIVAAPISTSAAGTTASRLLR